MDLQLLGPVQAQAAGRPVNLGVRRQRLVLAILALEVNRPVAVERLVQLMWPHDPPKSARGVVHTCVSGLRKLLIATGARSEGIWIARSGSGYMLLCDPERIDVHRFQSLITEARHSPDDECRVSLLSRAVALWHGPALEGTAGDDVRVRLCASIEEGRLTAIEDLIDARMRAGHQEGLIEQLIAHTAEHPYRPRLVGALMGLLHQAGRTPEALHTYQRFRRSLRDEFGLDPPAALTDQHLAILRAVPHSQVRCAQLPGDLASFTGRATELAALLTQSPSTVVAIDGMAGVGKTALAVHAAHLFAPQYPDGQIFLDLHGFTQGIDPIAPDEALDRLLRGLGVPGDIIPRQTHERSAMLRTMLATRQMLIVLDNAATEAQVRPLLPDSPRCLTMITGRCRLLSLDDVVPLSLDVLSHSESVELFSRVSGRDDPPDAVEPVVKLCGGLPLTIRMAAARLRRHPRWTAADLAEQLRGHRLGEISDLRAVIELSYRHLTPDQQRLLRLLAGHPGSEFDLHAAAAMVDLPDRETERLLEGLLDASLLAEPRPGRYRFHDLIRAYATQLDSGESHAALKRLYDFYIDTASVASLLLYPFDALGTPRPPAHLDDPAAWLEAELLNLLAIARADSPSHTLKLSAVLSRHLRVRSCPAYAEDLHTRALGIAERLGDHEHALTALIDLASVCYWLDRFDQAVAHSRRALTLAEDLGHLRGQVDALIGLGNVDIRTGRFKSSIDFYRPAVHLAERIGYHVSHVHALLGLGHALLLDQHLEEGDALLRKAATLAREIKYRVGELHAVAGLGRRACMSGQDEEALGHFTRSQIIAAEIGDTNGELLAHIGLGKSLLGVERFQQAIWHFRKALLMARAIGNRSGEMDALTGLGRTYGQIGRPGDAMANLNQGLAIAEELGHKAQG